MTTFTHQLPRWRHTLFGLFFLLGLSPLSADLSRSFESVTLEHEYLLDSDEVDGDPATNRHTAETTFEVEVATEPGDPSHFRYYRVAYRMKDDSGAPIDLVNGDPSHPTDPNKWAYTPAQLVIIFNTNPGTRNLTFDTVPDPVATLDSKTPYQVEGFLQERTSTNPEVWENVTVPIFTFTLPVRAATPLTQFLHFTNTVSGDPEYNVRAGISDLTWNRTHALATDPAADSFTASVDVFVNRWDDFDASASFTSIQFTADFDLIEVGSGNSIPLENDGLNDFTVGKFNHSFGASPNPVSRSTSNIAATIKPLQQLLSASETYLLRCTIRHEEDAIGTLFEDTVRDLNPEQLLHFNGNLSFGPLATTFEQLGNTPPILAGSGPTFVNTEIAIPADQGQIPSRPDYSFGDNTPLSVQLLNNGDSVIQAGSSQAVYLPGSPGATMGCDYGGIQINYDAITLSPRGWPSFPAPSPIPSWAKTTLTRLATFFSMTTSVPMPSPPSRWEPIPALPTSPIRCHFRSAT